MKTSVWRLIVPKLVLQASNSLSLGIIRYSSGFGNFLLTFSWMYAAWNFNLWVPIGLHMLMNAAWVIFDVTGTEDAAGGLISNIVRVASISLAIVITVYYHKKKGKKIFDYPIWGF